MKFLNLLSNLWKRPQCRVSESSSYLFDDQLTEATMKSANPSASEWAILEECFGLKGKVGPTPSAAAPSRRRKIA
jgi:hypothetical protein